MTWLEWIGAVAIYLVCWIGGGYVATIAFAVCLGRTKWARTAELAFFVPVLLFGGAWLVIGAVVGLVVLGATIAS